MGIIIRVDGGKDIGLGHIMRMLTLAHELKKNNSVKFACINSKKYYSGIEKIKENKFPITLLHKENHIQELCSLKGNCLITDNYEVDEKYFEITSKHFDVNCYMDDLAKLKYYQLDLIFNQILGSENKKYNTKLDTKLLLGSKYIILRDEFIGTPKKFIKNKLEKLLITVGGANLHNIAEKVVTTLLSLEYELNLIVGPGFNEESKSFLRKIEEENNNVILHYKPVMSELMQECDLAISACGGTLYELIACGVPTIGIILAENQVEPSIKLKNDRLLENLIYHNCFDEKILIESINLLGEDIGRRREASLRLQDFIDGRGKYRIVEEINNLIGGRI